MDYTQIKRRYMRFLRLERNYTQNTIDAYSHDIDYLINFLNNVSSGHRHYLYSAALLYRYAPYHHFAFLISHSIEAFKRNLWAAAKALPPAPRTAIIKAH